MLGHYLYLLCTLASYVHPPTTIQHDPPSGLLSEQPLILKVVIIIVYILVSSKMLFGMCSIYVLNKKLQYLKW